MTQLPTGLTAAEVAKKTQEGLHNDYETKTSKSTAAIIKDNLLTLFNFLNLLIGVFLFAVGTYSNMFYLAIIFVNITIGISQELHARNLVKKLSLVSPQTVRVIRDAQIHEISAKELVLEDVVILGAGDQIPADMTVLSGLVEVNEAMLTGEADLVVKEAGASLLSGSFIVSGEMTGTVLHVGAENYAAKLSNEAKVHKPIRSELLASIRSVSKFTSYVIVPLGVILFFQAFMMRDAGIKESVVVSAAALLGMLPKGLVLLISIALTTGVIKLAKKRILVQDMYAVETLAHVDTLCLDKTGTLTEGHMVLESIVPLQADSDPNMLLGNYLAASTDNNLTMQALRQGCPELTDHQPIDVAAFSSQRKWGAVAFEHLGNVYLGAPEKVAGSAALPQVIEAQEAGLRVLILAVETDPKTPTSFDPTNAQAVAVLILSDIIRQNAEETLAYLADQGIDLKVISGDNPIAVAAIAHRAGLANADQAIDLSTLTTEAEVREAATRYTVFGRVTPEQKKLLVQELKANQRTVAMTGDGVNDVLALREADVSIAMAAGDSAARQIANFVLLDSDFTTLPDVLFEGRRVVNNVTKASGIFFIKTIYSFLLSLVCILTSSAFPFLPIQITLIDLAIEGYPSFFLSFEENKAPIKGRYLPTVLLNALPNALLVLVNYFAIRFLQTDYGWSQFDTTTLLYYLLIGISCIAVIRACLPLNPLRLFLAITTTVGIYVAAMLFHGLLEVGFLTAVTLPYFLGMMALNICLYVGLSFLTKRFSAKMLVKQS
ncbi:HAD-IC family P-type ATPase [Enterococcus casseliflavus]|uniref:HAD-IC family P-type ATPase n=1 Tax=Enterococcus casseliflavus TaxID=37734 RepID=UPI0039A64A8B